MEIHALKTSTEVCISLKGRFDGTGVDDLEQEVAGLIDMDTRNLHFNCSDLEYISSAGIACILKLSRDLIARSTTISFSGVCGEVLKVFGFTGLTTLFPVKEGLERTGPAGPKPLTQTEQIERLMLPASADSLPCFQNFVRTYARRSGVAQTVFPTIELIVEEILVNIARHAYKDGHGDAGVSCSHDSDNLFMEFQDSGPEFNPLLLDPPDIDADIQDRKIGGLGVYLVRQLSADVQYERLEGRNIVRVKMKKNG